MRPALLASLCAMLVATLDASPSLADTAVSGFASCNSRSLMRVKRTTVQSDYRADLNRLDLSAKRASEFSRDPACAGAAAYWEGFAHWRYATNLANGPATSREAIAARLELAAVALRRAVAAMPSDPEAKIALMGVVQMRPIFEPQGSDNWRSAILESRALLAELEPIASTNPRFLWLRGGMHFWAPAPFGGGPDAAIATYRAGLAHLQDVHAQTVGLAPDWGEAELTMSIAYVAAKRADPDLALAEAQARAALRLRPDWHYVREILLPEILARRASTGA